MAEAGIRRTPLVALLVLLAVMVVGCSQGVSAAQTSTQAVAQPRIEPSPQATTPPSSQAPGQPVDQAAGPPTATAVAAPTDQVSSPAVSGIATPTATQVASQSSTGRAFYVSPDGRDDASGTLESPWKTVAKAVGRLSPGDTLYLRGGTYLESNIVTSARGTASAPITIESYPGEHATIDGGLPQFRTAPNSEWELVNSGIQLYRSKQSFPGKTVRAWLLGDDIQLVEYSDAANLESTNYGPVKGKDPLYIGPGLQLRGDGHIYIRLQPNPNDLTDAAGKSIAPQPADTDPNHNRIVVFTSSDVLQLDAVAYVQFRDLTFSYSQKILDVKGGTHNVELANCTLNYGTYGLVIRDGVKDLNIHDNRFYNGLPDWVYWTDVKNTSQESSEAYPEFQSSAITGPLTGFTVRANEFRKTFDGLDVQDGTKGASITDNVFREIRDDGIELYMGIGDVEVAHNLFWHVGSGVSVTGTDAAPGEVYIHHNVIDNSALQHGGRQGNYRQQDWPVWTTIDPFSSHGTKNRAAQWKLYNNTIVTRRGGYSWNAAGPTAVTATGEKYVYNNIFYVLDDRVIFRDDAASSGAHYDGNVFFRVAPGRYPLFSGFGNNQSYASLADFRSKSGTDWESHGIEADPGFSVAAIEDPTFDPATVWDRYRPTSAEVFTPGASYAGLSWPGTEGVAYRGAVAPSTGPAAGPAAGPATGPANGPAK